MKKAKIISKQKLHDGYVQLHQFDVEIPSLNPDKPPIQLTNREVLLTHDSILVLIYNPTLDSFVLCEEFRQGVFFNASEDDPMILQGVSGGIESGQSPEEAAIRETEEETGLIIQSLTLLAVIYKSPGLLTEKTYVYYSETQHIPPTTYHGIEDEEIKTHVLTRQDVYALMDKMTIVDAATLLALNCFRARDNSRG